MQNILLFSFSLNQEDCQSIALESFSKGSGQVSLNSYLLLSFSE